MSGKPSLNKIDLYLKFKTKLDDFVNLIASFYYNKLIKCGTNLFL
jgi:hypothetical protein